MRRADLIKEFRVVTQDLVEPFLFRKEWVAQWSVDAEAEAAIRGRLLHESDDAAVCEIDVSAGTSAYPLHAALYELSHVSFRCAGSAERRQLMLVSPEYLDSVMPAWRDRDGEPKYLIQNDSSVRIVPRPSVAGTVLLEGFRLPMAVLATTPSDALEIGVAHHRHLIHWMLHRAFSLPDAETLDLGRAADAEQAFTGYFGMRPGSDLRRTTREDVPQTNKAFFV